MAIDGLLQRAYALPFQDRDSWKPLLLPARCSGLLLLPGPVGVGRPALVIRARWGPKDGGEGKGREVIAGEPLVRGGGSGLRVPRRPTVPEMGTAGTLRRS
jgi:hypothetical protein